MAEKILVIDDEETTVQLISMLLERRGFEVVKAFSAEDGLRKAYRHQPDLVLLDVMMPDMDGPTTFRQLQANSSTQNIPVIFLTAKVQASDRRRYAEMGIQSVIAKPFDPLKLADQVSTSLGWEE